MVGLHRSFPQRVAAETKIVCDFFCFFPKGGYRLGLRFGFCLAAQIGADVKSHIGNGQALDFSGNATDAGDVGSAEHDIGASLPACNAIIAVAAWVEAELPRMDIHEPSLRLSFGCLQCTVNGLLELVLHFLGVSALFGCTQRDA